jgi:hypothetical protein
MPTFQHVTDPVAQNESTSAGASVPLSAPMRLREASQRSICGRRAPSRHGLPPLPGATPPHPARGGLSRLNPPSLTTVGAIPRTRLCDHRSLDSRRQPSPSWFSSWPRSGDGKSLVMVCDGLLIYHQALDENQGVPPRQQDLMPVPAGVPLGEAFGGRRLCREGRRSLSRVSMVPRAFRRGRWNWKRCVRPPVAAVPWEAEAFGAYFRCCCCCCRLKTIHKYGGTPRASLCHSTHLCTQTVPTKDIVVFLQLVTTRLTKHITQT